MTVRSLSRARLIGAGVLALVLAGLAGANALGNITQSRNPELALRVNPNDPVALVMLAARQQALRGNQILPGPSEVMLVRQSLQHLALNGIALQVLGVADAAQGRIGRARAEVALSNQITRRNLATQLWLIEDAVQRGNVADALAHYDVALRVSEGSEAVLFPILSKALEDRTLWPDFVPYVRGRVPWIGAYFRYAIRNSQRPDLVAGLAVRSGGLPGTEEFRGLGQELVGRLIEAGRYETALRYYRTLPGARPEIATRAALDADTTDPRYAPLTWQPSSQAQINTSILASSTGQGNSLYSVVDPGVRGVIARKLLMLTPGNYDLRGRQQLANDAEKADVTWTMSCAATKRELMSISAPLDDTMRSIRRGFALPAGCPAQFLTIVAAGGSGRNAAEIAIEQVSIARH